MAVEIGESIVTIGKDRRPAFALALVIARHLAHDEGRLAIGKLMGKLLLIAESVAATRDISLSLKMLLGIAVESAPISEAQAQTILLDAEAIIAALRNMNRDNGGRVQLAIVIKTLAKVRQNA